MVRFDPADPFDDETPAADPLGPAPVASPRRRSRRLAAPIVTPTNPLLEQAFPSWARPPKEPAAAPKRASSAAFFAGAGLALLDQILRLDPPFAGALRQRLALRAADRLRRAGAPSRGFFRAARRRASRAQVGGRAHQPRRANPSAVARFRPAVLAARRADAAKRRRSSRICRTPRVSKGSPTPCGTSLRRRKSARGGRGRERRGDETVWRRAARRRRDFGAVAERSGAGATARLGRAVPLLGTAIAHPSWRRSAAGKRPRPGDADWADALVRAYALAAREAFGLAGELSRRSQSLLAARQNCGRKARGGSSNFCWTTTPCRRRAPRKRRVSPIAPRVACSIGSSSSAPCANSPAARIFGSMDCSVFARSG